LAQSVEDYFLTLANSWAFDEFRKKRSESDNPYELIWYLNKYSELRNDYVKKVGEIMVQNNLARYDSYMLDANNFIKVKL
jgi:Bax protein